MTDIAIVSLEQPLETIADELGRSFAEYGFAVVRDHGIPQELIDRAGKRIGPVVIGLGLQHQMRILDRARHGAQLRPRHQGRRLVFRRHHARRRAEPDHPAKARGRAQAAAVITARCDRHHARGQRHGE